MKKSIEDNSDWSEEKVSEMISNNAEESVYLEFKSADALALTDGKKMDVCKDVSSFANSDGGTIVYGIREVNHKAASLSVIDGTIFTKEWLEQVINDGIQRRIDNVRIHPIRINSDIRKTIYVVEIPVSPLAPHMVKDNRYYKRFNFMSVKMEEYEVRQTFNRKQNVKLDIGEVSVSLYKTDTETLRRNCLTYHVGINLDNTGRALAKDYRIKIYMPSMIAETRIDNRELNLTSDILGTSISTLKTPTIFPGEELSVMHFEISLSYKTTHKSIPLHCFIYTESGYTDSVIDIVKKIEEMQKAGIDGLPKSKKDLLDML